MLPKCFCKWLVPLIVITHTLDATGKGTKPSGMEFKTPSSVTFLPVPRHMGQVHLPHCQEWGEVWLFRLCLLSFPPLSQGVCVLSEKIPLKSCLRCCRLNKGTKSILLEGLGSEMAHNHLTVILGIIVIFSRCILLYTASRMGYDTKKCYLSSVVIYLLSARGRRIHI